MISISTMLSPFLQMWYLLPILLIVLFFKTPLWKGIVGEFLVNSGISFKLDKNKYHLIKNVTLSLGAGTTQIDHIIVSEYGIFIIETKNIKGWIFGDEKQKYWTQKIYKHTNKFQNPLHQNYKHTKTIEDILNLSSDKIFSIVVFVGDSKFKTTMPENVHQGMSFVDYIKSKKQHIISKAEVSKIISHIESRRLAKSFKTHEEHRKHVENILKEKERYNTNYQGG